MENIKLPNYIRLFNKRCITIPMPLIDITGSRDAASFLSQLLFWSDKGHDPDGWIYKTQREMWDEVRLTRREQENARQILRDKGFITESKMGMPAKLYFKVSEDAVIQALDNYVRDPNPPKKHQDVTSGKHGCTPPAPVQPRMSDVADKDVTSGKHGCTKRHSSIYTEEYSEDYTESKSHSPDIPETGSDPSKSHSHSADAHGQTEEITPDNPKQTEQSKQPKGRKLPKKVTDEHLGRAKGLVEGWYVDLYTETARTRLVLDRTVLNKATREVARLLSEGKEEEEIKAICEWCRRDEFWSKNFISPAKLTERMDDGVRRYEWFLEKAVKPLGRESVGQQQNNNSQSPTPRTRRQLSTWEIKERMTAAKEELTDILYPGGCAYPKAEDQFRPGEKEEAIRLQKLIASLKKQLLSSDVENND